MILQGNHKPLSTTLELDFKILLPTLNIQLMLTFILTTTFKKSFISRFGPDIKNPTTLKYW